VAAQQQPSNQAPPPATDEEIAGVLGMLATGAAVAAVAGSLATFLHLPVRAAAAAVGIVGSLASFKQGPGAPGTSGVSGGPVAIERRANLRYRVAFIINAARRVAAAPDFKTAVAREKVYWAGHKQASDRRMKMAKRAAAARRTWGETLGWYAKMDKRTTAECRAADGRNFLASAPPVIGYPGTVHMHCRCLPGAPHPGAKMVDDSTTVQGSDAASGFHR
jgi:hypothetical protein